MGQARIGLNWYLAGSFSGEPVIRDCKIPFGRTIIFPVISAIAAAFPGDPPEQSTIEYLRNSIADVRDATNLEVEIDGASVPHVERFYEESVPFSLRLPADNIFGVEPTLAKPAVDAGYYIAIPPLAPGLHTLHFHGEVGEFSVDVTYNLTIKHTPFF